MRRFFFNTLVLFSFLAAAFLPALAYAQTTQDKGLVCDQSGQNCSYLLLEPLPINGLGTGTVGGSNLSVYLNGVIVLLIILGAMIAVARFSIGGIMYMTSEVAGTRQKAKSQMWACVWGLLLLISSVLILNTVNPQLVQFNLDDLGSLAGLGGGTPACGPSGC